MISVLYGGGFPLALVQLSVFYYTAGCILHYIVPRIFPVVSVQEHERRPGDVQRDCLHSLGPIAVKAAVWTLCESLHANKWSLLYTSSQPFAVHHVLYMILCTLVLDYLHDAWFYWTHRLLHWKPLYRHVHCLHHRSSAPSAFTGYSFHVIEALIVFANEVIVCFLLPLDLGLHRSYHIFTTLIHQGGHAGYEISPFLPHVSNAILAVFCGVNHNYIGFNTVKHHDMHHRFPSKHFSLYFTHWDRLCSTLHPAYWSYVVPYFASSPKAQRSPKIVVGQKSAAAAAC